MLKLTDKEDYVIDGEMLDWCLAWYIAIKQKLEYGKSEWLKPFNEFNFQKKKKLKLRVINLEMYCLN